MCSLEIFDFSNTKKLESWEVTDDVVMGGRSNSRFSINSEGKGVFQGKVSTENNGGFSSVRYRFNPIKVEGFSKFKLKVNGGNQRFQFRLKEKQTDDHSYIQYFETNGEWQEIEIELNNLYPTYRGNKLDKPNFNGNYIEEIGFLIGNNMNEEFRLEIDSIYLI